MFRYSEPITVLAWLWSQPSGWATYNAHHVNVWADMVRRNLTIPHRVACVTDMPKGIDPSIRIISPPREFEDVRIPTWSELKPQCFRRLTMFRRDAAEIFGRRFVCMDLDCVISGNLDSLFETDAPFKMCHGTREGRPYNGSMMLISAGTRPQVYEQFTPELAIEAGREFVGSDQAWISHILGPDEPTWGAADGVCWRGVPHAPDQRRIMFFPGLPKPWTIVDLAVNDWVVEHYRRSGRTQRCLMLGYGPDVWRDAGAAHAKYGALPVIASPEAAEHLNGPVVAIARTDRHADRLAAMYGYDPVWCGRTEPYTARSAA